VSTFQDALDIEPTYAAAYSGMGDAYAQLGYGGFLRPDDAFPKAKAAAARALELNPTLAEPHATLGFVAMYYDWDWIVAEREYERAIANDPRYATAHEWFGLFLAAMGRFTEAQAEERRALALEPLSLGIASTAGWVEHYSGNQPEAERQLRIALRTDSTFAVGHLYLGRVLQFNGQLDSALAHFAAMGPLRSWVPTIAGEGYVYAQQGRRDRARDVLRQLDSLSRTEYVTSYAIALVHVALAQPDSAFAWLNKAVDERTHWLLWLNRDRRWDPIRGDPRFRAVARRVGVPD
jgi:tetratricopeptide (TPR) repeat protein